MEQVHDVLRSQVLRRPELLHDARCTSNAARVANRGFVDGAVARSGADVLIVEERGDRSEGFYRELLLKHPSLKVFILTQEGRNVTLIEFRRVRFVDASPATLVEAIRSELQQETTLDEQ